MVGERAIQEKEDGRRQKETKQDRGDRKKLSKHVFPAEPHAGLIPGGLLEPELHLQVSPLVTC